MTFPVTLCEYVVNVKSKEGKKSVIVVHWKPGESSGGERSGVFLPS